jgi:hypothetical protein
MEGNNMTVIKLKGFNKPVKDVPLETEAGTIDVTPTWEATAKMLIVIMDQGTEEGKVFAREEITRMGQIIDAVRAGDLSEVVQ